MDQRMAIWVVGAFLVGAFIGYSLRGQAVAPSPASPVPADANKPYQGYSLHVDAEKHFPGDESKIAHHYCKEVRGGMFECQLYESDERDARLVGIEVVMPTVMYNQLPEAEKAMWHYHKTELPKINAKLPDLSAEEASKVAQSLEETYGKVYLLWDPSASDLPVGNPSITII